MNLTITDENDNPLMQRKEIEAELTFDKETPSRKEVKKALSDQMKNENIVIKIIKMKFGFQQAKVRANVYMDKGAMEKYEPEYLKTRDKGLKKGAEEKPEKEDGKAEEKK
ncbi:MAG: hypothetical protein KJ709_03160 [Nanoarchaeota archaeon]|nr:hypothetical protein [Nanoarchaeota archaeon]